MTTVTTIDARTRVTATPSECQRGGAHAPPLSRETDARMCGAGTVQLEHATVPLSPTEPARNQRLVATARAGGAWLR